MQQSQLSQRLLSLAIDHTSGAKKTKLDFLKEQFAACELCADKATAAAFGYLMGKEEEDSSMEPNIYDEICSTIEQAQNYRIVSEEACEIIMGLIYKWLEKKYEGEGFRAEVKEILDEAFEVYVKPGVIS